MLKNKSNIVYRFFWQLITGTARVAATPAVEKTARTLATIILHTEIVEEEKLV